jgi:hypothetical protein
MMQLRRIPTLATYLLACVVGRMNIAFLHGGQRVTATRSASQARKDYGYGTVGLGRYSAEAKGRAHF